jgi:hypothetical protein
MNLSLVNSALMLLTLIILGLTACAPIIPRATAMSQSNSPMESSSEAATPLEEPSEVSVPVSSGTKIIPLTSPLMKPGTPIASSFTADVTSSGRSTAFGDSYRINRFERPFLQDMTYIPDLDIISFNVVADADWYYVSMELNGDNPNNSIRINYGVEIDVNADGFGDYLLWAHPPYQTQWDQGTVQVFKDSNKDSAGLSGNQSDAVFDGNGYDELVFDGGTTENSNPDLAWVRRQEGQRAIIQFAFKKSWLGSSFMLGVISDAGPKDVTAFDYSDHFKEADAGSPVRGNQYYPLKSLYALDNTCWTAYGFRSLIFRPKFCPIPLSPTATQKPLRTITPTTPLTTNKPPTESSDVTETPAATVTPDATEPPAVTPPTTYP